MASNAIPEAMIELIVPHLPPLPEPEQTGGRPRVPHATILNVVWYVLVTGCRWSDVSPSLVFVVSQRVLACVIGRKWGSGIKCTKSYWSC